MKKTEKNILVLTLPMAMILSSGWNAFATISSSTNTTQMTEKKLHEEKTIISNTEEEANDSSINVFYNCVHSCSGSCGSYCGNSCAGSCATTCRGNCSSSCQTTCSYGCFNSSARSSRY